MLTFKFMVDKSFNESHLRHEEHVQSGAVGCNLVQWVFVNASNGLASSKRLTTKLHWKTNYHKYNFWKYLLNKFKFKIIKKRKNWNLTKKNAWYSILQKHLNQIGKESKMRIWGLREIWQENCMFNHYKSFGSRAEHLCHTSQKHSQIRMEWEFWVPLKSNKRSVH